MIIRLLWPESALSPNERHHWSVVSRAKKRYRTACWLLALEQKRGQRLPRPPLRLRMTFCPPARSRNRERHDRDNLNARMKSGIDGVCTALEIDDSVFVEVASRRGAPRGDGEVLFEIETDETNDASGGATT